MILQYRFIIIDYGQLRTSADKILIGDSRMINIMDTTGEDGREYLKGSEDFL